MNSQESGQHTFSDDGISPLLRHTLSRRSLLGRAAILGISFPTIAGLMTACDAEDDEDVAAEEPEVDDSDDEASQDDSETTDDEVADELDEEEEVVEDEDDAAPEDEPSDGGDVSVYWGSGALMPLEPLYTTSAVKQQVERLVFGSLIKMSAGIEPMPDAFFRRLAELFMVTSHWHIFPDAYRALRAIRQRELTVGAVSNWVWNLPELLHSLDLVGQFDFIAASARVGFEKPHPGIFRHALAKARARPNEVIHVGDHLDADVRGAENVGIEGVLIDRHRRHAAPPEGVRLIRSLDELIPIIDRRLAAAGRAGPPATQQAAAT
jgi:phosphoglycolate phosphatase-like HAD superfamily hydrolase